MEMFSRKYFENEVFIRFSFRIYTTKILPYTPKLQRGEQKDCQDIPKC